MSTIAVIGIFGRMGTYWMRDLVATLGWHPYDTDDVPLNIAHFPDIPDGTVFRTARPYGIHIRKASKFVIMLRDPRHALFSGQQVFGWDPIEQAQHVKAAWRHYQDEKRANRIAAPHTLIRYEDVPERWPSLLDFLGCARCPFPKLGYRGSWVEWNGREAINWKAAPVSMSGGRASDAFLYWGSKYYDKISGILEPELSDMGYV